MKRVVTALLGIPAVVFVTLYAADWLFALLVAVVAGTCFDELLAIAGRTRGARPGRWIVPLGAIVTASFFGGIGWAASALPAAFLISIAVTTFESPTDTAISRMGIAALGLFYCCFLLGFIVLLPREAVVVLLGIVWVGDSAAYYCGKMFGRHALAPVISPHKTIEGAVAGLIGSLLAGLVLGMRFLGDGAPASLAVGTAATAIAGQIGDLAESALKRSGGVKDSSSLLPGHGGMLDRLDSILFSAPVFYCFFSL
jgi:phosphatidate cytidylyltransferase